MWGVLLVAAVLCKQIHLQSLQDQVSASSDMAFVTQLAFLSAEEGSRAVLPCSVSSKTKLERPNFQWWYRIKNKKINVYPEDSSSPNHRGRVSVHPTVGQYSLSIAIARVQITDQLSYICSFSFILNGSYHIVHGNGTKLLVHGPLELTKSCFHLNLNLTCQVLVPDVDTSDSRDIAFLGWRGALNGEHLSGDSRQLLRKDGRMLLRSQISVATIHSQGTYTCWLHKGGHLLAQKSIQVVREGNPMLIYALVLIGSFLTFLVLITITVLQGWFTCHRRP